SEMSATKLIRRSGKLPARNALADSKQSFLSALIITFAPSCKNFLAICTPVFWLAPVTSTILFLNFIYNFKSSQVSASIQRSFRRAPFRGYDVDRNVTAH